MRPTLTKEFLLQEYITKRKSIKDLIRETGWSQSTICNRLKDYGITKKSLGGYPGRNSGTQLLTKEFLLKEYVERKQTTYQIAAATGVSPSAVQARLRRIGIRLRSRNEYGENLSGRKIGRLTVTNASRLTTFRGKKQTQWLCQCLCGYQKWILAHRIICGSTISCGCAEEEARRSIGSRTWTGHGQISGSYWKSILARARAKGMSFTITIEEAWDLFKRQGGKCAITGREITMTKRHRKRPRISDELRIASLDRIDSTKGYDVGNVQWVWSVVNIMKWILPQDKFVSICKDVVNHSCAF